MSVGSFPPLSPLIGQNGTRASRCCAISADTAVSSAASILGWHCWQAKERQAAPRPPLPAGLLGLGRRTLTLAEIRLSKKGENAPK